MKKLIRLLFNSKTMGQQINWDFKTNGNLEINDKNGNQIYSEDSSGYWRKSEYNSQGNQIYYENSNGVIVDYRPKPCKDKVIEIDGVKYKLVKQ